MPEERKFNSYDEFFTFYLQQHSDPRNRLLHAIGTTLGITIVIAAFWSFISDFRMLGLMFTGRLASRMKPQMPHS